MTVKGLYTQRKLICGGRVEQNYYNPSVGKKDGRIVTNTVCSVCYLDENIVDKVELLTCPEIVGKNQLPLCRIFLYMNIKFPATRWRVNPQQDREKSKQTKKRQLDTLVASGKRKCRKRS